MTDATPEALEAAWQAQFDHDHGAMDEYAALNVHSVADYWSMTVAACPDAVAIVDVHNPDSPPLSYADVDRASTVIAWHVYEELGVRAGHVVALSMENSPDFIITWLGLAKAGATVALLNTAVRGELLQHALEVSAASCIFASEAMAGHMPADSTVHVLPLRREGEGEGKCEPFSAMLRGSVRWNDPLFYIFTSGTTGRSKAAQFSHRRFIGAGVTWARHMRLTEADRYYNTLPLYHGNGGVVAVSAVWRARCALILRRKFSASNFIADVRTFGCTASVHIGEVWSYICAQPPSPADGDNPLRVVCGNGLRAETWREVVGRFGVERIVEHYGQTEMPAAHPMINSYGVVGSCGYIPPRVRGEAGTELLIQYDVDTDSPVRGADGWAVPVGPGEAGEAVVCLTDGVYGGYSNNQDTERVLYRDLFAPGDVWYHSGDLLKVDERGFFFFVDRAGDSFRWKGENVSANDVSGTLTRVDGVAEANVYGVQVPGHEGRCGMVALTLQPDTELQGVLAGLAAVCDAQLPSYAAPRFVRWLDGRENAKTTTFKLIKAAFAREGFDPAVVQDALFVRLAEGYEPLTPELYQALCSGEMRI